MDTKHDLVVHYGGNVHFISNVDPDRYSHIDMMDDVYQLVGSGRGFPKGFFSGYDRGSAPVTEKGTDIGGSSFVSARGGGYASAKVGRSISARGGGYATAISVARARGGGSTSANSGFISASYGGFARVVSDDDETMFTVSSFDEEYMCNSKEMDGNHSSGNDNENYEDEDWQDKNDGYISDYKSDDNCGAYSSDDDGQTKMTNKYLKGKVFEWKEGENIVLEKELWARHKFDPKVKSDHVTNNLVESFNNWVRNSRGKPVLILVDSIRSKVMGKVYMRYKLAASWESRVTLKIKRRLDETIQQSRHYRVVFAGGEEYEVLDTGIIHVVNLVARS
ncbi:hypothetical protein F0562_010113 [Nyssa sinensis]|uniref:Uncharacterized protein n=1 Tax=Nyssa sinensis TaxID=561372 RepID=A0A5J4ZZN0_9ASTE|nr:hypothetical protein F0562_010113 [Nyssa sinensis]